MQNERGVEFDVGIKVAARLDLVQDLDRDPFDFRQLMLSAEGGLTPEDLDRVMHRAKQLGLFSILDAKRGDIASTAAAYADAAFGVFDADAVTVNPYRARMPRKTNCSGSGAPWRAVAAACSSWLRWEPVAKTSSLRTKRSIGCVASPPR